MLKYLCFIILGILIYILLNSKDGFSIGGLNPGDECNPIEEDACYKRPGIICNIQNPCRCNLATNKCESDIHVAGTTGSTSVTSVTSATADGEEYILTGDYFHNAGIPIFVQYIVLNQHDNLDSIMSNLMTNPNLPPIYLGELNKLAERGGSLGIKVGRHFFIIDKKIYYFEKKNGVFEPKNFGNRERHPIILVNERLIKATLEIKAGSWGSGLHLEIIGTDGVTLYMYHTDRPTLEHVKNIIDAYMEQIRQIFLQSSCSVIVESSGNVVGDVTISLTYLSDVEAPYYAINTSGSSICDDINSVYGVYYFDKVEIDASLNINILEIDGTIPPGVRHLLRVLVYNGNIVLKYIKPIASGKYGLVCVASNIPFDQFNSHSDTGDAALAVGFKIYVSVLDDSNRSGQHDPEIDIINRINSTEDNIANCLRVGEIINALILTDSQDGYNMSIMRYMDGDLHNLLINSEYNAQGNLPFQIANRLMIALLCVQNNGYDFTDLKSQNVLYKCYKDNKLVISLGDLGSLHGVGRSGAMWTAYTIEAENQFTRSTSDSSLSVVYIYGLLILEVYRLVDYWEEFETIDPRFLVLNRPVCGLSPFCASIRDPVEYYSYINLNTIPELNQQFDALKIGTNNREIDFIKDLLSKIFVSEDSRKSFEEINTLFTQFNSSEEGEPPEPDQMIDCRSIEDQRVCGEIDGCVWNPDSGECTSD